MANAAASRSVSVHDVSDHERQRFGEKGEEIRTCVLEILGAPHVSSPPEGQPPPRHVRLPRIRKEAQAIGVATVDKGRRGRREPRLDLVVRLEAVVLPVGELPDTHDARVGVLVVSIPEVVRPALLGQVSEGVGDELDGRCGVGDEDQVEVFWVGSQEAQGLFSHLVDYRPGQFGRQVL